MSIITPCYNGAKYIEETIDSVIAQTYKNWEMLIVDDGLGYIKCIFRFNNHLRKIGFISFGAFLKGIFVRIVVSIIPNGLRKTIYSKALRK